MSLENTKTNFSVICMTVISSVQWFLMVENKMIFTSMISTAVWNHQIINRSIDYIYIYLKFHLCDFYIILGVWFWNDLWISSIWLLYEKHTVMKKVLQNAQTYWHDDLFRQLNQTEQLYSFESISRNLFWRHRLRGFLRVLRKYIFSSLYVSCEFSFWPRFRGGYYCKNYR